MEIKVKGEYIRLDTALKLAGLVPTGGAAKIIIQDQGVLVNDELDHRRGRKLYPGDEVEFAGQKIHIL